MMTPITLWEWPGLENRNILLSLQRAQPHPGPLLSSYSCTKGFRLSSNMGTPHSQPSRTARSKALKAWARYQTWICLPGTSGWRGTDTTQPVKTTHKALTRARVKEGFLEEAAPWKKKFGAVPCWAMLEPKAKKESAILNLLI